MSVYFEAQNLLDKPLELYQGTRSRTLQMEEYGRTYALGLKVALWGVASPSWPPRWQLRWSPAARRPPAPIRLRERPRRPPEASAW